MSRQTRVARLEKARGVGAWRTVVVSVPFGMSGEAALAQLGIQSKSYGMVILLADYSDPPDLPRVVSGDVGAG
jgi:hypothetical protein